MTVKNSYIELDAEAKELKNQNAGVFYAYDENSAYINFDFNTTIDIQQADEGFVVLDFDNEKVNTLVLDLNIINESNSAFIVLPAEYMDYVGDIYGEAYLKYPDHNLEVGKFTIHLRPSLVKTKTADIAEVYIPTFDQIKADYDGLKQQFEELGLGTFEDSVRKVNQVVAKDNTIYPAIKGYAEQERSTLDGADADNLPVGAYECTNLQNAPESMTGHTIEAMTLGGSENRRQTILIDSDTGEMYYKVFGSREGGESGALISWMRLQSERILWKNPSGNNLYAPVQLSPNALYFNTLRIRARLRGNEHVFYGNIVKGQENAGQIPINITNIWDDNSTISLSESLFILEKDGASAKVINPKEVRIKNGGSVQFNEENTILITEIAGIM